MNVGLVGFGRAGRAVANVLLQNDTICLSWVLRKNLLLEKQSVAECLGIESADPGTIYSLQKTEIAALLDERPVDFIIDFSSERGIHAYGHQAAERNIKIISAVSHYSYDSANFLKELSKKTVVFWSANMTFGVNYLMFAAKILQKIAPWADVKISEEHFREKKGISGTAKIIADELGIEPDDINTSRIGGIVGRHEVVFGFPYQTVRLTHESISREAFGNGAVFAANHLVDKANGFYKFEDLLLPYLVA